jgi:hypothetical protein
VLFSSYLIITTIFCEENELCSSSLRHFPQPLLCLSPSEIQIYSSAFCSQTHCLCCVVSARVSHTNYI